MKNKRRLIINADDFGIGVQISDAILEAHVSGIVSSATWMANMPGSKHALTRLKGVPSLRVGIHLNLTEGRPISKPSEVPDLVDKNGSFSNLLLKRKTLLCPNKTISLQIKTEFERQIIEGLSLGLMPTHCDSHHGIHKYPQCRKVLIGLLHKYNIPAVRAGVRTDLYGSLFKSSEVFSIRSLKYICVEVLNRINDYEYKRNRITYPHRYLANISRNNYSTQYDWLLTTLKNLPCGITEIAFHPGKKDNTWQEDSEISRHRENDFQLVTNNKIVEMIKRNSVELCDYTATYNGILKV